MFQRSKNFQTAIPITCNKKEFWFVKQSDELLIDGPTNLHKETFASLSFKYHQKIFEWLYRRISATTPGQAFGIKKSSSSGLYHGKKIVLNHFRLIFNYAQMLGLIESTIQPISLVYSGFHNRNKNRMESKFLSK